MIFSQLPVGVDDALTTHHWGKYVPGYVTLYCSTAWDDEG